MGKRPLSVYTENKQRRKNQEKDMFKKIAVTLSALLISFAANATTLTPNPSSKTTGSVTQGNYQYYDFSKLTGWKHTVCLKTTQGNADLYGHWTSAVSTGTWQYRSMETGLKYDCISFEATSYGSYYLAVYGTAAGTSNYEIYVVRNYMGTQWQLVGQLTCPLNPNNPNPCGTLTSSKFGPFGSTWGNALQNPFFTGDNDKFHIGVDWAIAENQPIYAVANGVVVRPNSSQGDSAWYGGDWGWFVVIEHEVNGYTFTAVYGHLSQAGRPNAGDVVNAGDQIGTIVDIQTKVDGEVNHLHFNMNSGTYQTAVGALPFNQFPSNYLNAGNQAHFQ